MSSLFGYDRGAAVSLSQAKSLASYDGGKFGSFFIRYLAGSSSWKYFSNTEVKNLLAAGYMIGSVFQEGRDGLKAGYNGGKVAAAKAKQRAEALGQPKNSAIFFAVDYDAPTSDYNAFEAFLKGAAEVFAGKYFVGVYGKYAVIEEMAKRGACKYFWQTLAWSGGKLSKHADLYQYKIDTTVNGVNVDYNECFNKEIFWGQYKEPVVTPAPTPEPVKPEPPKVETLSMYDDVPVTHWAAESIKKAYNKNVMIGVSDRKFGLTKEITREQLAAALDNVGLLETDVIAKTSVSLLYSDVPENHWAAKSIMKAFNKGALTGLGDGRFGIGQELTREQFVKVLSNLGLTNIGEDYWEIPDIYKDVPSDHWAAEAIEDAYLKGLVVGVGQYKFGLGEAVMREQLAKVLDNLGKLD